MAGASMGGTILPVRFGPGETAGIRRECASFLEILDIRSGAFYAYLTDTLTAQAEALERTQDESGGWHTLLNDDSTYLEASAAAGFGYGILKAVRKGYIDSRFRQMGERALAYITANIGPDGTLGQVSYGTGMGRDLEHYKNIPLCPMTYGQALAILILMEGLYCHEE